ncbi:hypothetical protein E2C01_063915 [Portunus trituberculatus]|uniref:Uncharacterized protein n=1 Tax=Portunus trituberculatus TaxID=210409 RepID=A0A5B7HJG3_PORTR|nr:hypothetical protein [Portunus trituberculatus]
MADDPGSPPLHWPYEVLAWGPSEASVEAAGPASFGAVWRHTGAPRARGDVIAGAKRAEAVNRFTSTGCSSLVGWGGRSGVMAVGDPIGSVAGNEDGAWKRRWL